MMGRVLLVGLFAAGCAEAAAARPGYAPVMSSQPVGAWQQFCEQAWNVPQASALVAARGADRWELVAMYNGALCYKRPAPEQQPQRPSGAATPPGPYVPLVRDP